MTSICRVPSLSKECLELQLPANKTLLTCLIHGKQLFHCNNICCLQARNIAANDVRVTAHSISGNCVSPLHSGLSSSKPIHSHPNAY